MKTFIQLTVAGALIGVMALVGDVRGGEIVSPPGSVIVTRQRRKIPDRPPGDQSQRAWLARRRR